MSWPTLSSIIFQNESPRTGNRINIYGTGSGGFSTGAERAARGHWASRGATQSGIDNGEGFSSVAARRPDIEQGNDNAAQNPGASEQNSNNPASSQQSADSDDHSAQIQEVTSSLSRALATNDTSWLDTARNAVDTLMERFSAQQAPRQQEQTEENYLNSQAQVQNRVPMLLATNGDSSLAPARTSIDTSMKRISTRRACPMQGQQAGNTAPASPPAPISEPEPEECAICYETITAYSTIQPCGHAYDYTCIIPWFETRWANSSDLNSLTCPLCRRLVLRVRHTFNEARTQYSSIVPYTESRIQHAGLGETVVDNFLTVTANDSQPVRIELELRLGDESRPRSMQMMVRREAGPPRLAGVLLGTREGDYIGDEVFEGLSEQEVQTMLDRRQNRQNFEAMGEGGATGLDDSENFDVNWRRNVQNVLNVDPSAVFSTLTAAEGREALEVVTQDLLESAYQARDNWYSGRRMSAADMVWGRPRLNAEEILEQVERANGR
ncbi:hypothetical protein EG329_003593 [Mollisiaceae sp. DMI_Dod_QoI]|nr:hypothetical protein EG329_003593 [Helotiales sp. DMI_Dod_QoI]